MNEIDLTASEKRFVEMTEYLANRWGCSQLDVVRSVCLTYHVKSADTGGRDDDAKAAEKDARRQRARDMVAETEWPKTWTEAQTDWRAKLGGNPYVAASLLMTAKHAGLIVKTGKLWAPVGVAVASAARGVGGRPKEDCRAMLEALDVRWPASWSDIVSAIEEHCECSGTVARAKFKRAGMLLARTDQKDWVYVGNLVGLTWPISVDDMPEMWRKIDEDYLAGDEDPVTGGCVFAPNKWLAGRIAAAEAQLEDQGFRSVSG